MLGGVTWPALHTWVAKPAQPWHINCTFVDMTVFVNIGGQGQVDTHAHVRAHTYKCTRYVHIARVPPPNSPLRSPSSLTTTSMLPSALPPPSQPPACSPTLSLVPHNHQHAPLRSPSSLTTTSMLSSALPPPSQPPACNEVIFTTTTDRGQRKECDTTQHLAHSSQATPNLQYPTVKFPLTTS